MNAALRSRHTIVLMEVRDAPLSPSPMDRHEAVWVHTTLDAAAGRLTLDLTTPNAVTTLEGDAGRTLKRWIRSIHGQRPGSDIVMTRGGSPAESCDSATPGPSSSGAVHVPARSACRPQGVDKGASDDFPVEHRGAINIQHFACRLILGLDMSRVECGISWLAQQAAVVLPERRAMHVRAALIELIVNAVEHGNLEITCGEKQAALAEHRYDVLLAARRRHPRFARRKVTVEAAFQERPKSIRYTVSDEGPGFDWPGVLGRGRREKPSQDANGRGLQLVRALFPDLTYNDAGTLAGFTLPLP